MSSPIHTHWRDQLEWDKMGLKFSTTSNETCKLYDAALSQLVGMYDEPSMGGLEKTVEKLMEHEPDFLMAYTLANGMEMIGSGTSPRLDKRFQASVDTMNKLAATSKPLEWEKKHAQAVNLWVEGRMPEAADVWQDILVEHPTDILAANFSTLTYFHLGYANQMRDSIAKILPKWKEDMPLYGYLLGFYSFGLEESNLYEEAEKVAKRGLKINPHDGMCTHTMDHLFEMQGRFEEGIQYMKATEPDWTFCGLFACHLFWHWALYHVEKGDYEGAFAIYDSELEPRSKSGAMFDIVDAVSLLYRLEMEGQDVGDRWVELYDLCEPHFDDHVVTFNDTHFIMASIGCKKKDSIDRILKSMDDFVQNGYGINQKMINDIGLPICQAMAAFEEGDYPKAVELVLPIRYQLRDLGGSHAQRDVFHLFLIHAALKSPLIKHKKLARSLLAERKALKQNAPMTDRLVAQLVAHDV